MKDDQSMATKADIQRLYDANERWKEELKQDFRLVIEHLRHDLLGVRNDKVEFLDDRTQGLDKRLTRVEARLGV